MVWPVLDLIASNLWYVSVIRLIDVQTLVPYWGASASLNGGRSLTVTGSMPDATLSALAMQALVDSSFHAPFSSPVLYLLAIDLLRLLLMRPRRLTVSDLSTPGPAWSATAWLRGQRVVSATGQMPDEALHNLVAVAPRHLLQ
jgi:hypothetical protein